MSVAEVSRIARERGEGLDWSLWEFEGSGAYEGTTYARFNLNWRGNAGSGYSAINYGLQMKALEKFAMDHSLLLYGATSEYIVNEYNNSVFYNFFLTDGVPPHGTTGYGTFLRIGERSSCPHCNAETSLYELQCTSCHNFLWCRNCTHSAQMWEHRRNGQRDRGDIGNFEIFDNGNFCSACSSLCPTCNNVWSDPYPNYLNLTNGSTTECFDCNPRFSCRNCGETELGTEEGTNGFCNHCYQYVCGSCENFNDEGNLIVEEGQRICSRCFNALDRNLEVFDDDSEMPATQLALPTIEGRERIRFCGLEIEGVNIHNDGHNIIARDMFELGLSDYDNRRGYHERTGGSGFIHIERDRTCDWEAVIGPINMANNTDVRNLNRVIKVIRSRIKDGTLKLSLNCGLHIHVSAERVGITQAHNLHLLYTYLEDIMYRLGAAKWPMHRAVVNGDHSYQLSPRSINKVHFINNYMENRYHGLSFSNYFQRMLNHCQCGAGRFGLFDECTCALTKCTFEFRIFNTTANTRKIHAYTALTQALVAKALSVTELDHEVLSELGFNIRNVKDMNVTEQDDLVEMWKPRMKYILEELPLTNEERMSILYCVENSELESVTEYCQSLMNLNAEVVV